MRFDLRSSGHLRRSLPVLPTGAWLDDPARFKLGLWARQTGKDYTCAAEAVFDCAHNPKTHWLILSCGERQARESLEKAREWAEAILTVAADVRRLTPDAGLKSSTMATNHTRRRMRLEREDVFPSSALSGG